MVVFGIRIINSKGMGKTPLQKLIEPALNPGINLVINCLRIVKIFLERATNNHLPNNSR